MRWEPFMWQHSVCVCVCVCATLNPNPQCGEAWRTTTARQTGIASTEQPAMDLQAVIESFAVAATACTYCDSQDIDETEAAEALRSLGRVLAGTGRECMEEHREAELAATVATSKWEAAWEAAEYGSKAWKTADNEMNRAVHRGEAARRQIGLLVLAMKLGKAEAEV